MPEKLGDSGTVNTLALQDRRLCNRLVTCSSKKEVTNNPQGLDA
jgi:hypothetical protein